MKTIILLIILLCGIYINACAEVKLPAIFGNHMVLQRDISVPVWGWAAPDEPVTVSLGSAKATTTADKDGKWMVRLVGLPASAAPSELAVVGSTNQIILHDVLVGDIWLCAGQSNMSFSLSQASTAKEEVPLANHPEIRLFVVKFHSALNAQTNFEGSWVLCTPETVKSFSAVGYLFAKEIAATEKVPVGMIGLYGGDAPAQAWTSLDTLRGDADLKKAYTDPILQNASNLDEIQKAHDQWMAAGGKIYLDAIIKWKADIDQAKKKGQVAPEQPQFPIGLAKEPIRPDDFRLPSVLNNSMIAPLTPYAIKGVIWYQGESNITPSDIYQNLFPAMIADWRKHWGQGDFPFLYVQLPNYSIRQSEPVDSTAWALMREAQLITLKTVPNTGMAITIDIGDSANIHPPDKADVARRLVLVARHIAYGENICFSGPIYDSYKVEGDKIHISFQNVGQGLKMGTSPLMHDVDASNNATEIKGFAIAGADRKFVWAKAVIDDPNTLCISSDQISEPVDIRYGWASNPEVNLYNSDNLPASPFRSDSPIIPPADATLVAQANDFFTINKIHFYNRLSNTELPVYEEAIKPDNNNNPRIAKLFVPYLEVGINTKESSKPNSLIARAYFYDQDKKLIASIQKPAIADRGDHQLTAWPAFLPKDKSQSIFFVIPDLVQQQLNWTVVVIFGDVNGVTAQLYPGSDELSEYDYPGKVPAKNPPSLTIEYKPAMDPIITHLEPTGNPDQPQITLFMRLPLGIANTSEAKGVLCMSLLAKDVADIKLQLRGLKAADQLGDILKFADDRKLIVICWGSHALWDPKQNWDDQTADKTGDTDKAFGQVAQAWEKGVQYFVKEYGIPQNNYLLWGISGSAQYACRLALRKPEYFLAINAHIPSSFDKPTPQANRILWCLTTGELESGHVRSLRFYYQCRALGYPMIYKAVVGLGHDWSPISTDLGLKFFAYALTVSDQRIAYEKSLNDPLIQQQLEQQASEGSVQPWLESFRKPAYVGDIINQEMFPYDQVDMVPAGFRTPLPTKDLANAWNK